MMAFPHFNRGAYGELKFGHLNEVFDSITSLQGQISTPGVGLHKRLMLLVNLAGPASPDFPMLALWNPAKLDFDGARLIEWPEAVQGGLIGDDDVSAALAALPPVALCIIGRDGQGRTRPIAFPAVSVVEGNVVQASPGDNPTYKVVSADGMFTALNVTPLDRTPGLLYTPRPDQFCLLVLRQNASGAPDVRMLAFEPFATEKCKPAAATATRNTSGSPSLAQLESRLQRLESLLAQKGIG